MKYSRIRPLILYKDGNMLGNLCTGYAMDPTVATETGNSLVARIPDVSLAPAVDPGEKAQTVFEKLAKRPADKRKRKKNDDPSDIEGFAGPWAAFVDEKRDITPSEVSWNSCLYHLF